jgi:hypothetical protein
MSYTLNILVSILPTFCLRSASTLYPKAVWLRGAILAFVDDAVGLVLIIVESHLDYQQLLAIDLRHVMVAFDRQFMAPIPRTSTHNVEDIPSTSSTAGAGGIAVDNLAIASAVGMAVLYFV